jgi:hypothetical protein
LMSESKLNISISLFIKIPIKKNEKSLIILFT